MGIRDIANIHTGRGTNIVIVRLTGIRIIGIGTQYTLLHSQASQQIYRPHNQRTRGRKYTTMTLWHLGIRTINYKGYKTTIIAVLKKNSKMPLNLFQKTTRKIREK